MRMLILPPHTPLSNSKTTTQKLGEGDVPYIYAVRKAEALKTKMLGRNTCASVGPACYCAAFSTSQPSSMRGSCWKHTAESSRSLSTVWPVIGKTCINKRRRNKRMGRPRRQSSIELPRFTDSAGKNPECYCLCFL